MTSIIFSKYSWYSTSPFYCLLDGKFRCHRFCALEHPEKIEFSGSCFPAISGYQYEGQPPQAVLEMIEARKDREIFNTQLNYRRRFGQIGFKRNPNSVNKKSPSWFVR